jgi:hypothetical protein
VAAGGIVAVLLAVAFLAFTGPTAEAPAFEAVPPGHTAAAQTSEGIPPPAAVTGPDDVTLSEPAALPGVEKLKKKRVRRSRRRDPAARASDKLFRQFE